MNTPDTVDSILTNRLRKLMNLAAQATNELIIDIASCPACGAAEGEYCWNGNGSGPHLFHTRSMHCDRRTVVSRWRKENPKQWKRMKDETFCRLVRELR